MAPTVRVVVHPEGVRELAEDPALEAFLLDVGRRVAAIARAGAPKRTGAGAASIRPETVLEPDGWSVRVSWDQAHDYMRFHDLGSRTIAPRRFLETALDMYARF